ncbi:hypothetical protein V6N13_073365 [Hibiscus sabdariffa]
MVQSTFEFEKFSSLPVENVQTLASKNLKNIPSRYIRPEFESDVVSAEESLQIPVIDMSKLDHDDEQTKLHFACKDWGFFQLINHGIPDELIEQMKADAREFFHLPSEERMACAQIPGHIEGYGHNRVPLIAKNLGMDPETLLSLFENEMQAIKMNHYPPCAEASKVLGASPHSDSSALTILLHANEVEGLQIKRNQKWVPVKPIPGAFTVNIGDVIEIMSNGEYKSVLHRAVVNGDKERLSIAAFHNQKLGTQVGPLQDLVKTNKPLYKTIPVEEFRRWKMTSKQDGKFMIRKMEL